MEWREYMSMCMLVTVVYYRFELLRSYIVDIRCA
jgi:hypothetical protein